MYSKRAAITIYLITCCCCVAFTNRRDAMNETEGPEMTTTSSGNSSEAEISVVEVVETSGEVVPKRVRKKKDDSIDRNTIEEVRQELDRAVHNLNRTSHGSSSPTRLVGSIINTRGRSLDPCSSIDCNNRGTCLGTKATFLCACQLGYSGKACEDTVCESARDCNGRGICIGTTNSLTCLCNLGFTGHRCETLI